MNKGDIAFFNFPSQGGNEQHGNRPAIIVSDKNNEPHRMVLVIPLTTKETALRFKYRTIFIPSLFHIPDYNNMIQPQNKH